MGALWEVALADPLMVDQAAAWVEFEVQQEVASGVLWGAALEEIEDPLVVAWEVLELVDPLEVAWEEIWARQEVA